MATENSEKRKHKINIGHENALNGFDLTEIDSTSIFVSFFVLTNTANKSMRPTCQLGF